MQFKFENAIIGGTFDHLHKGHKFFLDKAFKNSKFVTIGITIDTFAKDKELSSVIESFETRKNEVLKYLKEQGYDKRFKLIPISDIYGSSLTDRDIDVIFVDESGYENALKINHKRGEIGFSKIEIVKNSYVNDDDGKVLSSTKIRKGIVNRDGFVYRRSFSTSEILRLPLTLRDNLRKPFGKVINDFEKSKIDGKFVIGVGDVVVSKLFESGIFPNISIFDLKTRREKITDEKILLHIPKEDISIKNQQGTISKEVVEIMEDAIEKSLKKNRTFNIRIDGEEDLLALPAMLLAPLESLVIYGIRDKGSIVVEVTEILKEKIRKEYVEKLER